MTYHNVSLSSISNSSKFFVAILCFTCIETAISQPIVPTDSTSVSKTDSSSSIKESTFSPKNATYLWPTEASDYMSATFAETRAAHFHAAIDIKTWLRRGYKVFATRSGVIQRLSIGAYGYGKVVYLQHDDGSYSLYAHLDEFRSDLADSVDAWRLEREIFEIDTTFTEPIWTVEEGELIGFTGSTGIGPPHLHFELRTPTESPFNPLLTNISVPDNIAPRFSGILIEPLSPGTSINGKKGLYTKNVAYNNGYTFGTIRAKGKVGIAIDAFDQASNVANVYAVYGFRAMANEDTIFASKVDSFSYDHTGQMFIDRVYRQKMITNEGYQRLWMRDGNTLNFYDRSKSGLVFDSSGIYNIKIEAFDIYGNRRSARLKLILSEADKDSILVKSSSLPAKNGWEVPEAYWENDWFESNSITEIQTLGTWHSSFHKNLSISDLSGFLAIQNNSEIPFFRIQPKNDATLYSWDQAVSVDFPAHTFYDTLSVSLQNYWSGDTLFVLIFPDSEPVANDFILKALVPDSLKNKTTYRWYHRNDRRNRWTIRKSHFAENTIIGKVNDLGMYAAFPDTTPPLIENPRIIYDDRGAWRLAFDVKDFVSGIDYSRIRIYCNGKLGISEYEPDRDRIVYRHPDFVDERSVEFRAEVYDRAGNLTVLEGTAQR